MNLCFVDSSRSNPFARQLFAALSSELTALGVASELMQDEFPPHADGLVYAVIPHEYFENTFEELHPSPQQLKNTIALSLAPPGLLTTDSDLRHGKRCAAMMDVSPVGVVELRRRGMNAHRLTLGWTRAWDHYDESRARPIEILSYNSGSRRRELLLGRYAPVLSRHHVWIDRPGRAASASREPDWAFGAADRDLIGSAQVMLNARHQAPVYFDWPMAIQAICCGTVWLSEHGAGQSPLVAGEHFFAGDAGNLAFLAEALLADPERIRRTAASAYGLLRSEILLATGAQQLAELATDVAAGSAGSGGPLLHRGRRPDFTDPYTEGDLATHDPARLRAAYAANAERAAAKRKALDEIAAARARARREVAAEGRDPDAIAEIHRSRSYAKAKPRVTVCVPLYNHANEIGEALSSLVDQEYDAFDVIVHDDCSTDGSGDAVIAFSREHPRLPLRLLQRETNGGLPAGRNHLLAEARGEYVLALDADNALYPPCIARLSEALDGDPSALFAYGILETRIHGEPAGLLSARFWEPELLAHHNPYDALALFRRRRLLEFGGYVEDLELFGWEDYDVYCRCAEHGLHGVHVPQILARYRRGHESMLSITNLETDGLYAQLATRHPKLFSSQLP